MFTEFAKEKVEGMPEIWRKGPLINLSNGIKAQLIIRLATDKVFSL